MSVDKQFTFFVAEVPGQMDLAHGLVGKASKAAPASTLNNRRGTNGPGPSLPFQHRPMTRIANRVLDFERD